jgi:pre-mRNA-processing factor 17
MFVLRRKTTAEKKAAAARKAEALQDVDASAPFTLGQRQPWASKVAEVWAGMVWTGSASGSLLILSCELSFTYSAQVSELTEEQKEYMAKIEAEKAEAGASGSGAGDDNKGASSIFHGKADKDYQGEGGEGEGGTGITLCEG